MLHKDTKRRINDITKMAELFKDRGYPKTSQEILGYAKILKGDKPSTRKEFFKKWFPLFDVFEDEFIGMIGFGQEYRKRCFRNVKDIVLRVISKNYSIFSQMLWEIFGLIKRLKRGKEITGNIAEWTIPKRIPDRKLRVTLFCHAYLIIVEGLFDELARILYFFIKANQGIRLTHIDLMKVTVWRILREIQPRPAFLERYSAKRSIRNAIAHARSFYNPSTNEIRFVDISPRTGKTKYDKTMPVKDFAEILMELEVTVDAFYSIMFFCETSRFNPL